MMMGISERRRRGNADAAMATTEAISIESYCFAASARRRREQCSPLAGSPMMLCGGYFHRFTSRGGTDPNPDVARVAIALIVVVVAESVARAACSFAKVDGRGDLTRGRG